MNRSLRRARLLALLKQRSLAHHPVVLSSGKISDFYIDCKQTTLHPEGLKLTATWLLELLLERIAQGAELDAIAGPTLGADPIVSAICLLSESTAKPLPAIIVRKEAKAHGTGQFLEGAAFLTIPSHIAVIEDVVTSGASMLRAVQRVRDAGHLVEHCFAIIDREEGGREQLQAQGLSLTTLFNRSDFKEDV